MKYFSIIILLSYFVILFIIGFKSFRANNNFLIQKRNFKTFVLTATIVASLFSGNTIVTFFSFMYKYGNSIFLAQLGIVSGCFILAFLSKHQYSEVVFFGLIILALSTLTGYLMQAKTKAYRLILFFSFFTIVGIYYFEFLNFELVSTKLLLAQLCLNLIAVIALYSTQSLQNMNLIKSK